MSWWPATLTSQAMQAPPPRCYPAAAPRSPDLVGPAQHGLGRLLRQQLLRPLPAEHAAVEDGEPGQGETQGAGHGRRTRREREEECYSASNCSCSSWRVESSLTSTQPVLTFDC